MASSPDSVASVTSVLQGLQSQRGSVARLALTMGAKFVQSQNYEKALVSFRQAIALEPDLADAHVYSAKTYQLMGRVDDAVASYKRAILADPSSSGARAELARLCLTEGRYGEAEIQLKEILKTEPTSAGAHASLGYVYMNTDRLVEAGTQFDEVRRLAPKDPASYYNLGVLAGKQGRYEDAVSRFEQAIGLDRKYAAARADLALAYLELDQPDKALEQVEALYEIGTDEAGMLAFEVQASMVKPKILYEDIIRGTFDTHLGAGTTLDQLDPSLATPGASKVFTVVLQFNQSMDPLSVQNMSNWSISRAAGGEAGFYNDGSYLYSSRQISIGPLPLSVTYDPTNQRATVSFRITQNANGDGLIDPSHWVFRFGGTNLYGDPMDPNADEYDRFAVTGF